MLTMSLWFESEMAPEAHVLNIYFEGCGVFQEL